MRAKYSNASSRLFLRNAKPSCFPIWNGCSKDIFPFSGPVSIKIEKGDSYRISIEAEANEIKPFGVIRY